MDWISEECERQRRADQMREAEREAKNKALLAEGKGKNKSKEKGKDKNVRRALGSKLIEWGEQLQDGSSPNPSTAKI